MESQRPHGPEETETNETWHTIRDWWRQWGNTVLTAIIIVALIVAGYRFYTARQAQQHNAAWRDLATATSPDTLMNVAESHEVGAVSTLAKLRAADLLNDQAVTPATSDDQNQTAGEMLERARRLYEGIVSNENASPVIRANALLGLGAVAESQGNLEQARKQYQQLMELTRQPGLDHLAQQAESRLALLDQLSEPVVFAAPATQPAGPGEFGQPGSMQLPRGPGGGRSGGSGSIQLPGMGTPRPDAGTGNNSLSPAETPQTQPASP